MGPQTLTVAAEQRDALVHEVDDYRNHEGCHAEWWAPHWESVCVRVVDDLLLPDGAGSYQLKRLSRTELVGFLDHTLGLALETGLEPIWLQTWHTCVQLLDKLGYEVDGSIYEKTICHCESCQWTEKCKALVVAQIDALEDKDDGEARDLIFERFHRALELGPGSDAV